MRTVVKKVPHGTSTYQAAWIPDFDDDGDSENSEGDKDDFDIDIEVDNMNTLPTKVDMNEEKEEEDDDDIAEKKVSQKKVLCISYPLTACQVMFKDEENETFHHVSAAEEKKRLVDEEAEDEDFPDEVETPLDVPARVRFQKYISPSNITHRL